MSAVHCCVVWEWQSGGDWLPHAPAVARTLERAHHKRLTRVVLADADPALRGHAVNLRTLTQYSDTPDGGTEEFAVRRACYSVQSPAGRGVRWDWARLTHHQLEYDPLPMEVQCSLEEAWQRGAETVQWESWTLNVARMRARCGAGGGGARALRRGPQPPYPLARPPTPAPPTPPARTPVEAGRRPRIPQQHTGSSVHSVQSLHSLQSVKSVQSVQSAPARHGARSVSPKERKPGLARQILHNLNIFSSNNNKPASDREGKDEECGSAGDGGSTRSQRRHSVDTVSTYLSHESKESLQQASVGSLLNCSAGSDDVFDCPPAHPVHSAPAHVQSTTDLVCLDTDSENELIMEEEIAMCVSSMSSECARPQWGAICGCCLRALAGAAGAVPQPVVALRRCQHLLHRHCLLDQLQRLARAGRELHVQCRVCGMVYGPPPSAPPVAAGAQPPGSMAWRLQSTPLPQHTVPTIVVTYNFQSGRQGPMHPVPGAPYYAVGFPRYTLLPDNALGRQVLEALRAAWSCARLFGVSASLTTGREHVVSWRVSPPPHRADQYAAPAHVTAILLRAKQDLQRLTATDAA